MFSDKDFLKDRGISVFIRRSPISSIQKTAVFTTMIPKDEKFGQSVFYNNEQLAVTAPTIVATVDICLYTAIPNHTVDYNNNYIISAKFDNAGNIHDFTYGSMWDKVRETVVLPLSNMSLEEFERVAKRSMLFRESSEIVKEFCYRMLSFSPEDMTELNAYLTAYNTVSTALAKTAFDNAHGQTDLYSWWGKEDVNCDSGEVWYAPVVTYKFSEPTELPIAGLILYTLEQYYDCFMNTFAK